MLSTLAIILLVPYFGWGIHALRVRYRFHEELSLVAEAMTLLGLLLFYAVEISLLQEALRESRLQMMMAVLGLITSGVALFGHVAISFLSRLIVDAVVTGPDTRDDRPRLGPAEALEKQQDYHGALNEYFVIARMYPKDDILHLRIAALLVKLSRAEEAIPWLTRAAKCVGTEDRALSVTNRQIDLFEHHLARPDEARAALGAFLDRYPNAKEAPALRARLASIGHSAQGPRTATLAALADTPLADDAEKVAAKRVPKLETRAKKMDFTKDAPNREPEEVPGPDADAGNMESTLTALDDAPVMAEDAPTYTVAERSPDASSTGFTLEKLDDAAPFAAPEDDPPRPAHDGAGPSIALEPLDPS